MPELPTSIQNVGLDFKEAEDDQEMTFLESLRQGRGINLRLRADYATYSNFSRLIEEQKANLFGEEPDSLIIEHEFDSRETKITPLTGHPDEGGVPVPEQEKIFGKGMITFKKELPVIIAPNPNSLDALCINIGAMWFDLPVGESDPAEAAEWQEFCQALAERNTKNEDSRRERGLPVSYTPRVIASHLLTDTVFSGPVTSPVTNAPASRKRPNSTPFPLRLAQQTGQAMRTVTAAFGDAPKLYRWEIVEGQDALRHVIPNWPMQTLLQAGQSLSWWGRPASAQSLQEELKKLGVEAVFLANVLTGMCLQENQPTIAMDELIRAVGRGEEARKSAAHRAQVENEVWRAVLIFNDLALVGQPIGRYKTRDTKEILDVAMPGIEAIIKITGMTPGQTSSDGSAPPAYFSYVCGPWIAKMRGNRQILTEFGDVRRLARIPAGKPSAAWAKSVGLNLNQRWRDWGHDADVVRAGEANRLTVKFKKPFTRRDLLLGESLHRATPDAEDILGSDKPHRAKEYWEQAIVILKDKETANLISFYRETGPAVASRQGWQKEWLDQELDIRPNRESMEDVKELSQANARARRKSARPKSAA